MTERPAAAVPGIGPDAARIEGKLEPNAIGVTQDTVIGMASSAPAGTVAATLAALAAATAYGSGPVLLLCMVPMLIIANCCLSADRWVIMDAWPGGRPTGRGSMPRG